MRLKEEQIRQLAEKVYCDLSADNLVTPRGERKAVVEGIARTLSHNFAVEQKLERDAEKLLDETLDGLGRGAAEIDRRRMLKMIKDKLAKERNIVL
ncbi:MAG: DUF507 family protein [Desulfuromonadaceae bacterium]|nr:DUF507 family protein [Desulfuromonadaceae bacterium]MDD5106308.1 DUF507 family protein [Desulfuromonadaceae bacterium]